MRKSINELGFKWRLTGMNIFGGYEFVEIDVHNSNYHDATSVCKIIHGRRGWYIRFRRSTWYLDTEGETI